MPKVVQDKRVVYSASHSWQMKYDWREAGEEWSAPWGSSAAQWNGTIFPRIRDCVPVGAILEIAPGFGRWTHYLKDYCEELGRGSWVGRGSGSWEEDREDRGQI